jgi:tetratricopeptide (TPR) repeat protein
LIFAMLLGGITPAQDNIKPEHASNRVYVIDFGEVTPETATSEANSGRVSTRDIAQLATSYIRLRLQETPTLEVIASDKEPACGLHANQTESNATKMPPRGQTPAQYANQQREIVEPNGGEFFVIRGSVDTHPPNVAVNYWLGKCNGSTLNELASDRSILVADRSSFVAETVLGPLGTISRFLAYKLEGLQNPPTTVAVGQFGPSSDKFAAALTQYVKQALTLPPGVELSEIARSPDYIVDGEVTTGRTEIRVEIRLRSARGAHDVITPIEVSGTHKLQWAFERKVVSRIYEALNDQRLAKRFASDVLSAKSFDSLIEEGRHLLCQDQPRGCRQDASAAAVVFRAAKMNPKADWSASYYLGMAQASTYKYSDAVESLKESLSEVSASTAKGPEADKSIVQVRNTLGDVYLRYGDGKNGVLQYEESLKINPDQPEVYVKRAEALFVDDRPGAMKVLLDGVHRAPTGSELHTALLENVRKLQEGDFKAVQKEFEQAFADGVPMTDEYALLWVLWGETGSVNADTVRQRQYVTNALDLHPADVQVQAQAYALRAAIDLPGNLEEVDKYLAQAEALPAEKLDGNTLSWVARLRAIYWLDRKDYARASDWAEKARAIDTSSASQLLSADVANNWAKSLAERDVRDEQANKLFTKARDVVLPLVESRYEGADSVLHTANHGLGLDQDSKKVFKTIVDKNPKDFSATLSLAFVCSEYLFDTACSYTQNRKLLDLDLSALSPADRQAMKLNAAEAAVLQHDYRQASVWLNELALPGLGADYRAIADFYKTWIAFARKQADSQSDFDQLRQALTAYTELQKKGEVQPSGWSFQGARHALAHSELPLQKQKLLSDVIAVIEDPTKNTAAIPMPTEI